VLAALWIAIRISHTPFADYLALRWPSWTNLAIGIVALIVVVMGWDLLRARRDAKFARLYGRGAEFGRADGSLWLLVIAFVVAAPISEEFFARGFLYRGWSESFLGPAGGIMLSSLVWTALHLQYDWFFFGEVFSIGLLLGYLRYRFNSTWLTVIVHGLNNLAAVAQTILLIGQG
jgi:CAAX amino terminal protease family.